MPQTCVSRLALLCTGWADPSLLQEHHAWIDRIEETQALVLLLLLFVFTITVLYCSTPRWGPGPWPVRNWTAQQEVSGRLVREASSVFTASPYCSHYGELYNYFVICQNIIIIEIKYTINVMHLNHPETQPPPLQSMEKLPSMKPVPGAKKARDYCSVGLFLSKQVNTKLCSFLI